MSVVSVESTTLATVAYDEARQLLQIEFCSRAVYLYFGVPAAVHAALLAAPSKGKCFHQTIRGRFSYRPILDSGGVGRDEQMPAQWRS
jgi:hypothetical protein